MGGSNSSQAILKEVNEQTASIITSISLNCAVSDTASQIVSIDCEPQNGATGSYADNSACLSLIENLKQTEFTRYDAMEAAGSRTGQKRLKPIEEDLNPFFSALMDAGSTGPCKMCSFVDIEQIIQTTANADCDLTNAIQNTIDQSITDKVNQSLQSHRDILAAMAQALGANSYEDLVQNISNRARSLLTTDIVSNAIATINLNQTFTASGGAVTGIRQQSVQSSVLTFLQANNVMNNIFEKTETDQIQAAINNQNTIGELGDIVAESVSDIAKFLKHTVGQVVVFVWFVVIVIFVFVAIFATVKLIQKSWRANEDRKLRKELMANAPPEDF